VELGCGRVAAAAGLVLCVCVVAEPAGEGMWKRAESPAFVGWLAWVEGVPLPAVNPGQLIRLDLHAL